MSKIEKQDKKINKDEADLIDKLVVKLPALIFSSLIFLSNNFERFFK